VVQRIKCDETRPQCKNCIDRHLECPGFARQLRWKTNPAFVTAPTCVGQSPRRQQTQPRGNSTLVPHQSIKEDQSRPDLDPAAWGPERALQPQHSHSEEIATPLFSTDYLDRNPLDKRPCPDHVPSPCDRRQSVAPSSNMLALGPRNPDPTCFIRTLVNTSAQFEELCPPVELCFPMPSYQNWSFASDDATFTSTDDLRPRSNQLFSTKQSEAMASVHNMAAGETW